MAEAGRVKWNEDVNKTYETGTRQGMLYLRDNTGAYPEGEVWDGLTAVTESPSGAEVTKLYADDGVYLNLRSAEEFGATIEAYAYPKTFKQCDGTAEVVPGMNIGQQDRKPFGLSYRTIKGNAVEFENYGYLIHLVYGATASPSEKAYQTVNDSPEAITFSWEIATTPVNVTGFKPTALITLDSTEIPVEKLAALEDILYGKDATTGETPTEATVPRLPLPDEIASIIGPAQG
jgi:hypothetical protein